VKCLAACYVPVKVDEVTDARRCSASLLAVDRRSDVVHCRRLSSGTQGTGRVGHDLHCGRFDAQLTMCRVHQYCQQPVFIITMAHTLLD